MSPILTSPLAGSPFATTLPAAARPIVLSASLLLPVISHALPLQIHHRAAFNGEQTPMNPTEASLWIYLAIAALLVLLGGVFAGLTIALMGQDEINLQVLAASGDSSERKNAARVLSLLKKGKHWVLVTLLLSNVITNETLPIVLDRSLGGGWPAVLSSTCLIGMSPHHSFRVVPAADWLLLAIVIFGEVVPQSICVRYGLPIGAWMAPIVLGIMWILSPVAWPTAKLLDYCLGVDHGTTYKKAGLKTLVFLHKTLGSSPDERLNEDEVTIISAVLDLKAKSVGSIMTPMADVFTMSADAVLDQKTMSSILSAGYSRVPIYHPERPHDFVGMLLVKLLITYDPDDCKRVRDFALATLPETLPRTSCLDIVNFFQEGKSHMVLVSDHPGEAYGAIGVVTLEDVIEELIGEEIIDESDVFIDVHKAIPRASPAPRTRVPERQGNSDRPPQADADDVAPLPSESEGRGKTTDSVRMNSKVMRMLRRTTSSGHGSTEGSPSFAQRDDRAEFREHVKYLGPSNSARRPKSTRITTVTIKPGVSIIPEAETTGNTCGHGESHPTEPPKVGPTAIQGGIGEGALPNSGSGANDDEHAVAVPRTSVAPGVPVVDSQQNIITGNRPTAETRLSSSDTIASTLSEPPRSVSPRSAGVGNDAVKTGSLSENHIDVNGIRKIVIAVPSSSDEDGREHRSCSEHQRSYSDHSQSDGAQPGSSKNPYPEVAQSSPTSSTELLLGTRPKSSLRRKRKRAMW